MKAQGYTILELLVVMAFIGILSAIGLLSYLSYRDRARVDEAAASFTQMISVATGHARKNSTVVNISVNPTTRVIQASTAASVVLFNKTLNLTGMTLTCRLSSCTTGNNTFVLLSPGGGFPDDLSLTLTSNARSQSFKVVGPSALVVYR